VDKAAFLVKAVDAPAEAGLDLFRTSPCPELYRTLARGARRHPPPRDPSG